MSLIEKTKELAQRLVGLLEDPHPGLLTWQLAVCDVLSDLAEVAPGKYQRPGKTHPGFKASDCAVGVTEHGDVVYAIVPGEPCWQPPQHDHEENR